MSQASRNIYLIILLALVFVGGLLGLTVSKQAEAQSSLVEDCWWEIADVYQDASGTYHIDLDLRCECVPAGTEGTHGSGGGELEEGGF